MATNGYTTRGMRTIVPKVKATLLNADGEGEVIDVLGEIREIEKGLAFLRQGSQVEFETGQRGKSWQVVIPVKNERSYNTPRIIKKFAEAIGGTPWQAFVMLLRGDVVRLEWQFKKLLAAAQTYDLTIATAQHEIVEGDDADIGVFPATSYPKYEPIE